MKVYNCFTHLNNNMAYIQNSYLGNHCMKDKNLNRIISNLQTKISSKIFLMNLFDNLLFLHLVLNLVSILAIIQSSNHFKNSYTDKFGNYCFISHTIKKCPAQEETSSLLKTNL